jgi:mono/diheme cytochrome c family protein
MSRTTWIAIALALLPASAPAQMGMMQGHGMGMMQGHGMGMMGGSAVRRSYVMRFGVDPRYAGAVNPLPATTANVEAGKKLYESTCAPCHGMQGYGDGPAAKTLDPPPARLAGLGRMPMTSDGYLYWTIAEGGAPVKSAMPPFKASLSKDDIWKIVLYVRVL